MELGPISHVPTPASAQFLSALTSGDWDAALAVVDEHWAELWYAVDPTDLRRVLGQAPPSLLSELRNVNYIARIAGHGPVEDLVEPELAPAASGDVMAGAQYLAALRLQGRPVEAMGRVRRLEAIVRARRGRLIDTTGGLTGLWQIQAAITALLAGEMPTARGMLLEARTAHRPERFPFVNREATAKLALVHAVEGDIANARAQLAQARTMRRTESWVEKLVDDTIWLTDYICAVDALDPRAEELRRDRPSPMDHLEFWGIALHAHVRHLVLTGRSEQAAALCDAVSAVGLPPAGADGTIATAISDAQLAYRVGPRTQRPAAAPVTAHSELSRVLGLFVTGQFPAVIDLGRQGLPPCHDCRPQLAVDLLVAQAMSAVGLADEGRAHLDDALGAVLDRQVLSSLSYLTPETVASLGGTEVGRRVADLVEEHALPLLEVTVVLQAPLTEAETAVMSMVQQGLSRAEAAEQLHLSINTVKTQLSSAYRKLGATDRAEAVALFARLGH